MKLALITTLVLLANSNAFAQSPTAAELIWDEWGVPHVYAGTTRDAAYALGRAQIEAHGQGIAVGYLMARGEAAACMGPDMLDLDRRMHILDVPGRAARWLSIQSTEPGDMLEAFATGMNDWLHENPPSGGPLECLGEVRASDALGFLQLALHVSVVAFNADRMIEDWEDPRGSNAYAISSERSRDGRPLLFINPHSPWQGPFVSFEEHIVTPDLHIYGMTFPGLPLPIMGFSDQHGWAQTFNDIDGIDLYEIEFSDEGYVFGGEVREFETREVMVSVRNTDGSLTTETLEIRETVHGPILIQRNNRALAVRIAGLDRPHLFEQGLAMARGASLEAFKAALAQQQMPITNVVFNNAQGETFYVFNGLAPVRKTGDRDFWSGILDGSDPALLWTDYLPFNAMPQIEQPATGFVQNSNDGPTTSTWPPALDLTQWDATLTDDVLTPRGRRSVRQLLEIGKMDFDDMDRLRRSTVMDVAQRARPLLADYARASRDSVLHEIGQILRDWDGSTQPDSRGSVLFAEWAYRMMRDGRVMFADAIDPVDTTQRLADPRSALELLRRAGEVMIERYGRLDPTWGDVYRIRHAGLDLPSGVGRDELGAYRAGHYAFDRDTSTFSLTSGPHFVAMVAFGDDGPEARGLMSYGNSGRPDAIGVREQLQLFSNGEVRAIYYSKEAVEAAAIRRESFVFDP